MPLLPGYSQKTVSANVVKLRGEGYSHGQAIRIALQNARRTGGKRARRKYPEPPEKK